LAPSPTRTKTSGNATSGFRGKEREGQGFRRKRREGEKEHAANQQGGKNKNRNGFGVQGIKEVVSKALRNPGPSIRNKAITKWSKGGAKNMDS